MTFSLGFLSSPYGALRPISSSYNPKPRPLKLITPKLKTQTLAARDTVIDFGKHKGKMLGTLPSTYLRWISNNLRAADYEHWAKLADEVLEDSIYRDRIEWEYADRVLNGGDSAANHDGSAAVDVLVEVSERFGWDNDDKIGWSKVDFGRLGTSNGGRIPRRSSSCRERVERESEKKENEEAVESRERREERRERMRIKVKKGVETEKGKMGIVGSASRGTFGNESNVDGGKDPTVVMSNPFPGREVLLKKALDRRKF